MQFRVVLTIKIVVSALLSFSGAGWRLLPSSPRSPVTLTAPSWSSFDLAIDCPHALFSRLLESGLPVEVLTGLWKRAVFLFRAGDLHIHPVFSQRFRPRCSVVSICPSKFSLPHLLHFFPPPSKYNSLPALTGHTQRRKKDCANRLAHNKWGLRREELQKGDDQWRGRTFELLLERRALYPLRHGKESGGGSERIFSTEK